MHRHIERARYAYAKVGEIVAEGRCAKEYKIAVHAMGASLLRSGLAAALATIERRSDAAAGARASGRLRDPRVLWRACGAPRADPLQYGDRAVSAGDARDVATAPLAEAGCPGANPTREPPPPSSRRTCR